LSVADSGSGIPAADLERIFHRFARADPRLRRGGITGYPGIIRPAPDRAAVSTAAALAATPGDKAVDALPHYQPSKVVSEAAEHFQLTTIASMSMVGSFYKTALKGRGWRILYTGKNAGSTDIAAMSGSNGVGISISHADPAGAAILVLACDC
jgi:hypothetical protein